MRFIMKRSKTVLKWTAVTVFWLAVWQLGSMAVGQEILIPSPAAVVLSLKSLALTAAFWQAVLFSMLRILIGFLLGVVAGVLGAVASSRFRPLWALTYPLRQLVRAVPVASFIILALFWFQSDVLPAAISFLVVLPIVWDSVETGLKQLDKNLLEMAQVFRIGNLKTFIFIKTPSVFPAFLSACMTALGFAWKSGIAAEILCRPAASLGGMLQSAKVYIETPQVFALTIVVAALSLLLERIIRRAVRGAINDPS